MAQINDTAVYFGKVIAVGDNGLIRLVEGSTYTVLDSGTTENLTKITTITSLIRTPDQWIVVGDNDTMILSQDQGETWEAIINAVE
jgi:photosystem II stability/assembly factor-like uncharacterized protein